MSLDLLHKLVFALMFVMFLVSNYVIVLKFMQWAKRPNTSMVEAINYSKILKSNLWWLDFSATTAPLLGLLGTIIALMEAFQRLSTKGLAGASEISNAIGFALVATAIGIGLSLWNYFFFKLFQDRFHTYKYSIKHKLLKEVFGEEKTTSDSLSF